MKIYYLNDEDRSVTVQVNGQLRPSLTNPYGEPTIEYFKLGPKEGRMFDVDAPDGAIPWIKKWSTPIVLLSFLPASSELLSHHDEPND
jgi:hypothetical protein